MLLAVLGGSSVTETGWVLNAKDEETSWTSHIGALSIRARQACRDARMEFEVPPERLLHGIGVVDENHFWDTQEQVFVEVASRLQISRSDRVVDLGCGSGRFAMPLSQFLDNGTYVGVDIWKEAINWCNLNVRPLAPERIDFVHHRIDHDYYFGGVEAQAVNRALLDFLPPDSADVAIAVSVFTHLLQGDAEVYLGELSRVLASGGRAYLSAFVKDVDFERERVRRDGWHTRLREDGEALYGYEGPDFFAAFPLRWWTTQFESHSLRLCAYLPGVWASKMGSRDSYQDAFVVERL